MSDQLKLRGYQVGRRKAGRYMREMDITPIYPKMNLSKRMKQAKVCPYLLRNAVIDRPHQASQTVPFPFPFPPAPFPGVPQNSGSC